MVSSHGYAKPRSLKYDNLSTAPDDRKANDDFGSVNSLTIHCLGVQVLH